jgi:hypothetical protein
MDQVNIKKELHQFIDSGDDKLLKLMYAVAKEYSDDSPEDTFSADDLALFEERRQKRLAGESQLYSWQVAKNMITGKRPDA